MEDEADEEMEKNKTMRTTFSELGSFLEGENSTVPISNRVGILGTRNGGHFCKNII